MPRERTGRALSITSLQCTSIDCTSPAQLPDPDPDGAQAVHLNDAPAFIAS